MQGAVRAGRLSLTFPFPADLNFNQGPQIGPSDGDAFPDSMDIVSTAEFDDASGGKRVSDPAAKAQPESQTPGVVAPEKRGQIYTLHAFEGVNAAELINSALRKRVVGGAAPRRVEVAAPSGPSTAGGRKARQSITLVPVSGQGQAIMIGFLDVAHKTAGIRDFELVAKQYKARFREKLQIGSDEFQVMLKELTGMLATLGFRLVKDEPREDGRYSDAGSLAPNDGVGGRNVLLAAAGLVIVVLLALLLAR